MKKDDNTFELDLGLGDTYKDEEEIEVRQEKFLSTLTDERGHLSFAPNLNGILRILYFKSVANKDYLKGSTFALCRIPQGKVRILGNLSQVYGSISSYKVGWGGFKDRYSSKHAGFDNGFLEKGSENKAYNILGQSNLDTTLFDSLEGIQMFATALKNGKKGDFIEGVVIYIK